VNITLELMRPNVQTEFLAQEEAKAMEKVVRGFVALMDQRILTMYLRGIGVVIVNTRDVGIVLPQSGTRSTHIRKEFARVSQVQVPHRGGECNDVARR